MLRLLMTLVLVAFATPALATDREVNAVYDRMSAAYVTLDRASLSTVYAADAILLPASQTLGPLIGQAAILDYFKVPFDRAAASGEQMRLDFRIVQRRWHGNIAVDVGYYRFTRQKGTTKQTSVGKFTTTVARQPDGSWAFVSDADTPCPPELWDQAREASGVRFDR